MTATSALAAPRGPSVLGRAPRLEERGEAAAPAQLGGSLGIASSSRPARVFQPRSRQPFLCAVLSGERSPAAGAGGRLDLQLHQPLGCKRQHLAHEIGVRVLLHEPEKSHPLAGLVVSPVGSRSGNPNPCRRPAMAAPGQRHQPPTPPRRALPWASTTRWRLRSPACPGPLGSARSSCAATSAPFCGTGRGSSIEARLQSSASAAASRSRRHPMQRAQHAGAMPVAQPAPARHAGAAERLAGQPLPADARPRATNTMPSRACRSSHRGRPPFGFGGSGGSRGSTAAHNSSLTRGPVITPNAARPDGCCQGLLVLQLRLKGGHGLVSLSLKGAFEGCGPWRWRSGPGR